MVNLTRIYTRTGDRGTTALGDMSRVPKTDLRISAYADANEANAVIGTAIALGGLEEEIVTVLTRVQNDLFDVGADLCWPLAEGEQPGQCLRVTAAQAERLERAIDRLNEPLAPLRSFVLPGGTPAAAWLHLARTVCRRAERAVVTLMRTEPVNPQVVVYLNRLSDLLFVLARVANDGGKSDVLWVPGQSRG